MGWVTHRVRKGWEWGVVIDVCSSKKTMHSPFSLQLQRGDHETVNLILTCVECRRVGLVSERETRQGAILGLCE